MCRVTSFLSYHLVSEWRPVFPLAEMLSAGSSQKPQARPIAKKLLLGSLLKPLTGFWEALTHKWIQPTQKTTRKWGKKRKKGNPTEWPRFMTFWRCGRAAKTYMLPRKNLSLRTSRWPPWDTFWTRKRSSIYWGHSFNIMVQLHSDCQKDLICHHVCLRRTLLKDELKYLISAESQESTLIQSKVMSIAHWKAFRTQKIGFTGMGTKMIQMTTKTIARRTLNLIQRKTIALRIPNPQSSGMWAPRQIFLEWLGLHGSRRDSLKSCWWRSMQLNEEESGSEAKVGHSASMFCQLLYVSWPRVLVRDI